MKYLLKILKGLFSYHIDREEKGRNSLLKVYYYAYPVFKYMQLNKNKYKYCIILRNDIDFSLNFDILNEIIEKSNNDKIVLPSHSHIKKYYSIDSDEVKCLDKKHNFGIRHTLQKKNDHRMAFELSTFLICSKWNILYDLFEIHSENTFFKYNIWNNSESWFYGIYILQKENKEYFGLHTRTSPLNLSTSEIEILVNKYFDFFDIYDFEKNICNVCAYVNKDYFNRKSTFYYKDSIYPCLICKKKNIFE